MTTMQVNWLGTPAAKRPAARPPPGLGLYDHLGVPPGTLGQPPAACPSGPTPAAYTQCRNNALAKAQATAKQVCNAQFQPSGDPGTDEALLKQCVAESTTYHFNLYFSQDDCLGKCPGASPPCNSTTIIKDVQAALGRPVTGFWTEDDQGALIAAGYGGPDGFKDFAPVCSGPAPVPTKPGGGGGGPQPVPPAPTPTSSGEGTNWGLVLLALAAGVGILWSQG